MRTRIDVGTIQAEPGTVAKGSLEVGELSDGCGVIRVPVIVVNGRHDGPLLYLQGGAHGQETVYAVEVLRRLLFTQLQPEALRGAIVAVPIANPLAHQAACRVSPQYAAREGIPYGGDLHKVWPGDPRGSITQRIAHVLWTTIVSRCNFAIDYHAVSLPGMAFSFMYRGGKTEAVGTPQWERSLQMARAFGVTVITTAPNPLPLAGACLDAGKPALMVEMPVPRAHDERMVAAALRGTRNVLIDVGMMDGEIVPQSDLLVISGERRALPSIRANRGGIILFEAECGAFLPAGTPIARTFNAFGDEVELIRMPSDGYVMTYPPVSWVGNQAVATGDYVADIFA
jgi:predicted deacylase